MYILRNLFILMPCVSSEPNRCTAGGRLLFNKDWLRDFWHWNGDCRPLNDWYLLWRCQNFV